MSRQFYDGVRMRSRRPGEKKPYSATGVVLKMVYGPFHLLGLSVSRRVVRIADRSLAFCRGYG